MVNDLVRPPSRHGAGLLHRSATAFQRRTLFMSLGQPGTRHRQNHRRGEQYQASNITHRFLRFAKRRQPNALQVVIRGLLAAVIALGLVCSAPHIVRRMARSFSGKNNSIGRVSPTPCRSMAPTDARKPPAGLAKALDFAIEEESSHFNLRYSPVIAATGIGWTGVSGSSSATILSSKPTSPFGSSQSHSPFALTSKNQ